MSQQFLSRTEVAEYLGVSKDTLNQMEKTPGALPLPVVVSKSKKYDREAIENHFRPQADKFLSEHEL
jgi:hypothetical protein